MQMCTRARVIHHSRTLTHLLQVLDLAEWSVQHHHWLRGVACTVGLFACCFGRAVDAHTREGGNALGFDHRLGQLVHAHLCVLCVSVCSGCVCVCVICLCVCVHWQAFTMRNGLVMESTLTFKNFMLLRRSSDDLRTLQISG